ncbi:LIC_13387 family protein [Spirosoma sp.]|uniref:LIC_13387 family protein n=1 Tax=Spirosoma sp. TaxID=1899569 RepID=UPI003B3A0349
MLSKYLWMTGSLTIATLGSIHLYLTFFTTAFSSTNEKMVQQMQASSPMLSPAINMWKAWIGLNASHSSGLLFMGLLNFYLALRYFGHVQSDPFFFIITILTIGFYVWLAEKYWFTIPLLGVLMALICFVVSYVLTLTND